MTSNLSFTLPTTLDVFAESPVQLPSNAIFSESLKENLKEGKRRYFILRNGEEINLQFTIGRDTEGDCLISPYIVVNDNLTLGGIIVLFEYSSLQTIEILTPFTLLSGRNSYPLSFFLIPIEVLNLLRERNVIPASLFFFLNGNFIERRIFLSLLPEDRLGIFNPFVFSIEVNIRSVITV